MTNEELAVQRGKDRKAILDCFDGKTLADRVIRALVCNEDASSDERSIAIAIRKMWDAEDLTDGERAALVAAGPRGVFVCDVCEGRGRLPHFHTEDCNPGWNGEGGCSNASRTCYKCKGSRVKS